MAYGDSEALDAARAEIHRLEVGYERLRKALVELADAAEVYAGSEPDMPTHESNEREFEGALERARAALRIEP